MSALVPISEDIRQHLVGLVLAVAQHDDAVQIVAFGRQRIFKPMKAVNLPGSL